MKLSQAKGYLPFIQAAAEGKTIQHRSQRSDGWKDINPERHYFDAEDVPDIEFRIKPTPTLRAWRPEEVPVGALIRRNDIDFCSNPVALILARRGAWIHFMCPETAKLIEVTVNNIVDNNNYSHSLDQGLTWFPCGVLVNE
jgi:hypothetical protein